MKPCSSPNMLPNLRLMQGISSNDQFNFHVYFNLFEYLNLFWSIFFIELYCLSVEISAKINLKKRLKQQKICKIRSSMIKYSVVKENIDELWEISVGC